MVDRRTSDRKSSDPKKIQTGPNSDHEIRADNAHQQSLKEGLIEDISEEDDFSSIIPPITISITSRGENRRRNINLPCPIVVSAKGRNSKNVGHTPSGSKSPPSVYGSFDSQLASVPLMEEDLNANTLTQIKDNNNRLIGLLYSLK